jgi:hypothetical protein
MVMKRPMVAFLTQLLLAGYRVAVHAASAT